MHMAVAVNVNQGHPINIESITLCAIVWRVSCLQFSVPKCDLNEWLYKDPGNLSFFLIVFFFLLFKSHIIWSLTICHDHNYHQGAFLEFIGEGLWSVFKRFSSNSSVMREADVCHQREATLLRRLSSVVFFGTAPGCVEYACAHLSRVCGWDDARNRPCCRHSFFQGTCGNMRVCRAQCHKIILFMCRSEVRIL